MASGSVTVHMTEVREFKTAIALLREFVAQGNQQYVPDEDMESLMAEAETFLEHFEEDHDALDALRAALRSTPAAPKEDDRDCGAYHPDHPGTRCRRKPGHAGEHATARYDVTWDNAYLSGPEADHA